MSETTNTVQEVTATQSTEQIKKDRMRFITNKLSSNLTLLAIVFNLFYFVSIYKSNVPYYYNYKIGLSVLYNLVFMLAAFLCSESIKNYKLGYGIVLIVVGALQLLRIVYFPMQAHNAEMTVGTEVVRVMLDWQFIRVVAYLVLSAALLIAAGIIGIIRSKTLKNYRAEIGDEIPA